VGAGATQSIIDGGGATTQDRVFHIISGEVSISGVTIRNSRLGYYQSGAGVFVEPAGALTLSNSTVTDNTAFSTAGIASGGDLTLTGCTVSNNRSEDDIGGVGVGHHDGSELVIVDSTIANNTGSGISSSSDAVGILTNTVVISNTAAEGGGIYASGPLRISASAIVSNTAGGEGGGIYAADPLTVTNSTISNNTAGNDGGGIYVYDPVDLSSVTLAGNVSDADDNGSGDGGGIYVYDPAGVSFRNTIIAGNTDSGGEGPDCYTDWGALNSYGYCLVQDTTGCSISGDTTGNQTGVNPSLGPLRDNGGATFTHALLPGSLAIDAGNPAGCVDGSGSPLSTDQRGLLRVEDGDDNGSAICDIGAYEEWKPSDWVCFPLIRR
jgi:predicted outer membrane repeat protein